MLSQNCLNFYDNENLTLQIDFPGHLDAFSEAVAQRFSLKKVFLEISQNSLENNYARAWGVFL